MKAFSRRVIRLRACFIAAALLFTLFAMAEQACALPSMAPAMVFSGSGDPEPCAGMNGNVCLTQFLQGDQALDSTPLFITSSSASPLLVAFNEPATSISAAAVAPPPHQTGPPLRTRLCRLLI